MAVGDRNSPYLRRRRKPPAKKRKYRLHKPVWRDPYPWIPGTVPEKMVFAELIDKGMYFIFQDTTPEYKQGISPLTANPRITPDFILPEYRTIIDPFGDYHHTLPEVVLRDIDKDVYYQALGYYFFHPWTSQIVSQGAEAVLQECPPLRSGPTHPFPAEELPYRSQGYRLGPFVGLGSTSVAAANRKRRKTPLLSIRYR